MATLSPRSTHSNRNLTNHKSGPARRGYVTARERPEPTPLTQYSIYDGQDRLRSFRRDGNSFTAFDRRGQLIGTFSSQGEAIAAIDPEASP